MRFCPPTRSRRIISVPSRITLSATMCVAMFFVSAGTPLPSGINIFVATFARAIKNFSGYGSAALKYFPTFTASARTAFYAYFGSRRAGVEFPATEATDNSEAFGKMPIAHKMGIVFPEFTISKRMAFRA